MKINRVLIPTIRPELLQLRSWIFYCPPPGVRDVRLQLAIDTEWSESERESITKLFRTSALHDSGWVLDFLSCGMTPEESFYIKDGKQPIDIGRFPYGHKSGPNMQFFRSLRKVIEGEPGARAALLMEVDAFPVVENWLARLEARIELLSGVRPLVAGANYAGASPLAEQIRSHLNGNSIYFVGDPDFRQFLDDWEKLLLDSLRVVPFVAYDVVIPWYVNYREVNAKVAKITGDYIGRLEAAFAARLVSISDALVNYGGAVESEPSYSYDVIDFRQRHPDALVVHGKCFFFTIHLLRLSYRYPKRNVKLNIVHDALKDGLLDESLCSGVDDVDLIDVVRQRLALDPRSPFHRLAS